MHRIAVVSDSHVPDRVDAIPDAFRERIRRADHAIHAGDFTAPEVRDEFDDLAGGDLIAVRGNVDPDLGLPAVATLRREGITFVVTHGTGSRRDYEERVAGIVREAAGEDALGIAGHTHEVLDATSGGVRLLNPGSVTGAAPAARATMMTVAIDDGVDVTVHGTD